MNISDPLYGHKIVLKPSPYDTPTKYLMIHCACGYTQGYNTISPGFTVGLAAYQDFLSHLPLEIPIEIEKES